MTPVRLLTLTCLLAWAVAAQVNGRIEGSMRDDSSAPLANLSVQLMRGNERVATQATDDRGHFIFADVVPGKYLVILKLADGGEYPMEAVVTGGGTVTLDQPVPANVGLLARTTVYAASRETETVLSAPAAITAVDPISKTLYGAGGQLPLMLASVPGAEVTQSGLFDFNFNTRGFNSLLNRRVAMQVDGRNVAVPFLGNQEWASFALMTDDITTMEMMRGPSAALYGQNSFNGIVNITTTEPRENTGGELRFTFGQMKTATLAGRWARGLGRGWFFKTAGGYEGGDDFSKSRNKSVEYPGLPMEVIPLPTRHVDLASGTVRADKYFSDRTMLTLEGGVQSLAGPVYVIGIGRAAGDAIRTFTRARFTTPGWTLSFFSNTRDSPDLPALGSGLPVTIRDRNAQGEAQWSHQFGASTYMLAGGSYTYEFVDTAGRNGIQTLLARQISNSRGAAYGQIRHDLTRQLTVAAALRMDASQIHETQVSPRASILYHVTPNQSLWAGFSRAFQVANFSELFLSIPAGPPADLSGIEASFAPLLNGTPLGLGVVPVLGLGNSSLKVEKVRTWQTGYTFSLRGRTMVTLDYYHSTMRDFITDPMMGVNPAYGPYQAPSSLSPAVRQIIENALHAALPGLTNGPNGAPWLVLSFTNVGRVASQGVEIGVNGWLSPHWQYGANFSWFDYSLNDASARSEVHSNSAPYRGFGSLGYHLRRFDADVRYRWNDTFFFANGFFRGQVPTYSIVDAGAAYRISPKWKVGVNAANLLDNQHYEEFGGDILKRRVLGFIAFSWK